MRKIAEKSVRFNCRIPVDVADWLGARAKKHGLTLSEEMRLLILDIKSGHDQILSMAKGVAIEAVENKFDK